MFRLRPAFWFLFLPLLFIFHCGGDNKPQQKNAAPPISGFAQIRDLILKEKCTRCHLALESYSNVMTIVSPGNAGESELYNEIASGSMPPSGRKLTDQEISAIENWIKQGGKND